jgi:UDP-glucose 4-epimerase
LTEFSPVNPISPYGLSKYIAESYVRVLSEARKSEWSSLALSNAYGSVKIQKQGVIYRFWEDISKGINPTIFGAEVSRDFIHIDDVVSALMKAIEKPVNSRLNISSNTSTKLVDLLAEMQCIMGSSLKPIIRDLPLGEVGANQLSNKRAQELLNWAPQMDLSSSLKDILSVN